MEEDTLDRLVKYTKALLVLQVQALNKDDDPLKPEVVLARAGLSAREIAQLVGKTEAAVAKAIQRASKNGN